MPDLAGPSKSSKNLSTISPLGSDPIPADPAVAASAPAPNIEPPVPPQGGGIFGGPASTDSSLGGPAAPSFIPPGSAANQQGSDTSTSTFNKKLLIIPLIILLVAAGSFGGYYYYTNIYKKSEEGKSTVEDELNQDRNFGTISTTPSPVVSPPSKTAGNVYVNSALGFSFEAPNGWQKVDIPPLDVSYQSPQLEFDANNVQYQANLNIITEELSPDITLEAYGAESNNNRIANFEYYELLGSANDNLGGKPAQIDDYIVSVGTLNLRQRQVYTVHNGRGYIFTFTTLPESWEKHLPTLDEVRNSFTFSGTVSGARIGI